ncbi:uncharacterized protein G2W53_016961 [Senna tora]|uniref:Uncharacterized protein n=1 Tax=Senna tora TaxID=362788 RepID=A0A834TQ22_9FABA|nr:uncharacterized protein G2W53_016961 [Senna tora]
MKHTGQEALVYGRGLLKSVTLLHEKDVRNLVSRNKAAYVKPSHGPT